MLAIMLLAEPNGHHECMATTMMTIKVAKTKRLLKKHAMRILS